jgi:hypothetical protein
MKKEKFLQELNRQRGAKTNLKAQKIELGLVQDLLIEYRTGVDLFTDAQSIMDRSLEQFLLAQNIYNDISSKASDLGVDLDSEVQEYGENLISFIESARQR